MANFFKNFKFPDIINGKILTLGNNHELKATDIDVTNVAKQTDLQAIDNRLTNIESSINNISYQLTDINGE